MFFDFLSLMSAAALMTLGLAVCSLIVGLLFSLVFVLLEASRLVGKPVSVLIALLRGLPEILVVLLVYFECGVFALSLIFAAYASQTLRGAIQAVPKGQWESGAALGLSKGYTFVHVIMPQVWRHALPGLSNQWLVLLKDTALISLIGVDDLMRQAQLINTNTHQPFTWYGIAALIYLGVTIISQAGIRRLELRFTRFERGGK